MSAPVHIRLHARTHKYDVSQTYVSVADCMERKSGVANMVMTRNVHIVHLTHPRCTNRVQASSTAACDEAIIWQLCVCVWLTHWFPVRYALRLNKKLSTTIMWQCSLWGSSWGEESDERVIQHCRSWDELVSLCENKYGTGKTDRGGLREYRGSSSTAVVVVVVVDYVN
jgi:hypothetical protein